MQVCNYSIQEVEVREFRFLDQFDVYIKILFQKFIEKKKKRKRENIRIKLFVNF